MPTKTLPSHFGFCVVLIIATACGPLVPLSYNYEDPDEPQYLGIETDEVSVFLEYTESKYNHYVFDLEVINHTQSELSVAPQFISYYVSGNAFKPLDSLTDVHTLSAPNSELFMKRQFANSPERTRNVFREKMGSDLNTAGLLIGLVGIAIAIYDAEKDKEDSKKETLTRREENEGIGRNILVSVAQTASEAAIDIAQEVKEDNINIPYKLFAESKIMPGDSVRGTIFLRKKPSRYQRIVVPVGNFDYVFDFRRGDVKPTRSQLLRHPSVDAQRK